MTFMILFSIAMGQSPADTDADSKTEPVDTSESSGTTSDSQDDSPDEPADSESLEAESERKEKSDVKNQPPEKKQTITLVNDFCPSGIKVPNLDDDNKKRELEQQWMNINLERYLEQSEYILIGEIAGHRSLMANEGRDMMVDVIVHDWLRGKEGAVMSIHVPYNTPFIPGCPETVPPTVVDGYKMIFFLDKQKMVIEGNALFYLEANYAWRNKRPDVFLSPRTDRDWVATDPTIDYVMYELSKIRSGIDASNARRSFIAQVEPEADQPPLERWWQFWK